MVGNIKDLTGQQFGSLIAMSISHKQKDGTAYWLFRCKCGKTHIARGNTVKYAANKGDTELPSCGCIELSRKTKHGFRKKEDTHPAYRIYRGIMTRCYSITCPGYKWYGAKGVTVCDEWKGDPAAFVKWAIQSGYQSGLHIDKDIICDQLNIHPHIYSPTTCQWVTPKVNVGYATNRDNFGKHPNIRLSHEQVSEILTLYHSGEITNQSELARMYNVYSSTINRLISLSLKG